MLRYIFIIIVIGFSYGDSGNVDLIKMSSKTPQSDPTPKPIDKWVGIDKVQHFLYSFFITLGCQYVLVNKNQKTEKEALPISAALSFSAGLLKEIQDSRGARGFFSKKDMVANLGGIICANMVILDSN